MSDQGIKGGAREGEREERIVKMRGERNENETLSHSLFFPNQSMDLILGNMLSCSLLLKTRKREKIEGRITCASCTDARSHKRTLTEAR